MNLGELFDAARGELRAAAAGMAGRAPHDTMDILTVITARASIYTSLARCVTAVAGGTLTVDRGLLDRGSAQSMATGLMRERGQHANKLYALLRAGAHTGGYPSAAEPKSPVSRHLQQAADFVGAAADLLAGHVPPDGPLRTREGVALRAGGATRDGLALIAELAGLTLRVDTQLPDWLAARHIEDRTFTDRLTAALRPAQWTASSGLDELASRLAARVTSAPHLRLLEPAAPTPGDEPPIPGTPGARLTAVCDWLVRNPGQVDARHLRAGTQLGLGLSLLGDASHRDGWRAAARAATQLSSAPTGGPAAYVAAELTELAADVRDLLHADLSTAGTGHALAAVAPDLARALHNGLVAGVARRGIFVADAGLSTQPVKLIYRYQITARPATVDDAAVIDTSRGLSDACHEAKPPASMFSARAARAFPVPPRPGVEPEPRRGIDVISLMATRRTRR